MENNNNLMEKDLADQNISSSQSKKGNIFVRFGKKVAEIWNFFTTYEKIWLFTLWGAGIAISLLFPDEENTTTTLVVLSIITLLGGMLCELLLSKQSKWAFVVSFLFYDITYTTICFITGRYLTALLEIVFWIPMLIISFFTWEKRKDKEEKQKVVVKGLNLKKEFAIFITVAAVSVGLGFLFTYIEGMTEYWYLDAIVVTFNVCNGLFIWLRYKEQWIAWICVVIGETIMYILFRNWALLILQVGYLTNSIYGYIVWTLYIRKHKKSSIIKNDFSVNVLKLSNPIRIKKDDE